MCSLAQILATGLTGDSDYLQLTFKMVVEHIHETALDSAGRRHRYARTALEILLLLAKKTTFPLVDVLWINKLLRRAAAGKKMDDVFVLFLRLRALGKEEDCAADGQLPIGPEFAHVQDLESDLHSLGGAVTSEAPTPERILLSTISKNIKTCSDREGGWEDGAVYGGLVVIRDIHHLQACIPEFSFLKTLAEAMEKDNPPRVRNAAYDIIQAAQDGWLRLADLRDTFEKLDFPRQLHSVVIAPGCSGHQLSFLKMMEILSEDRYWHPYLRGAMDLWLGFCHEGTDQVIQILLRVGEIPPPEVGHCLPLDNHLVKIVEDEWARVPGRPAKDLSADLLGPFAEVTTQLKELLFTETDRQAVVDVVERVLPSLEMRRDDGYEGPGKDIVKLINDLLNDLRIPTVSTGHRSSYWC